MRVQGSCVKLFPFISYKHNNKSTKTLCQIILYYKSSSHQWQKNVILSSNSLLPVIKLTMSV